MKDTWKQKAIGEVATIDRKGIAPEDIKDNTNYVGLENISSTGKIINIQNVKNGDLASTKFSFTDQHVLYGKLRPYLNKVACPKDMGICSTDILPILPGATLDKNFLYYCLRRQETVNLATVRSEGINLPRLSPQALAEIEIPIPPLAEQKRIALLLDRADALREKRRQCITKLDTLMQSVFFDMFGDPGTNPKLWKEYELGEFISEGPQNGLYKHSDEYGQGRPIVRIDTFYDGEFSSSENLKRLNVTNNELKTYGLSPDDILINRVNSMPYLGKSAIVPELGEPTVFESNMMRLKCSPELNPVFLIYFLQSSYIKKQILKRAKKAVNQASINQDDVRSFRIFVPPIDKQQEFANIRPMQFSLIESTKLSKFSLDTLFNSLQQRAFRGEL